MTVKHPSWILVVDHGYIRDWCRFEDGYNPVSIMGLTHGPISLKRQSDARNKAGGPELYKRLSLRQRNALEIDENYLQFLPYAVITKQNGRLISTYTRTKLVGEARLAGKKSIGWGGHPENDMMIWEGGNVLDFKKSLHNCVLTELGQECRFFSPSTLEPANGLVYNVGELSEGKGLLHYGFIYDRQNDVGRKHLAVVDVLNLPDEVEMASNEEELRYDGWATLDELKADYDKYEPWSQILIDTMLGGLFAPNDPKTVQPLPGIAPANAPEADNSPLSELARKIGEPNQ